MKIDNVETTLYRIPLPTPIQAASTPVMTEFDLVMARVRDSYGATGCGYTVLSAGQGVGVAAIIDNVFAHIARDEDPRRIEWLWSRMWRAHHYAGRGGPVSFAIAALDTALWDLKGRTLREPLWRLLGGHRPEVRAYAGNIDLKFSAREAIGGREPQPCGGIQVHQDASGQAQFARGRAASGSGARAPRARHRAHGRRQ